MPMAERLAVGALCEVHSGVLRLNAEVFVGRGVTAALKQTKVFALVQKNGWYRGRLGLSSLSKGQKVFLFLV